MELILTDEQKMLRDSAAALMERYAGADRLRARRDGGGALDETLWSGIGEAGWLAMLLSEDAGGFGLGVTDMALVLAEAGKAVSTAPACAVMASAQAIANGESATLRDELLPRLLAGDALVVPALQDTATAYEADGQQVQAEPAGEGLSLSGRKAVVPDAEEAGGYLVPADEPQGTVLCYVPKDAQGVAVAIRRTVDGGNVGQVTLSNVAIGRDAVVAGPNHAPSLIAQLRDTMLIGLSAELHGVMERALEIAVEYLKVREQFGRPIGSFQALQHRAVNDYVEVEKTRSLLYQTCTAFDEGRGTPEMAAALKAQASLSASHVTKSAIQMHGGIGFTDEHDIGFYLKRAMSLAAQHGNATVQRRRFAELTGIEPAA